MSESQDDIAALDRRDNRLLRFVSAFDQEWRDGLIEETVGGLADWSEEDRLEALQQLVLVDHERQWCAGRDVLVEEYLRRWPLLEAAGDGLIELLFSEWELRRERGEVNAESDLARRFPKCAVELARRIQEHVSAGSSLSFPTIDTSRRGKHSPVTGATPKVAVEPLQQLGRFQIEGLLGEGAFGRVYRAKDPALQRVVAIKVPKSMVTEEERQRFRREARSAANLRHSNICVVYESGTLDGHDFIVMEFIDGQPLSELLASRPMLSAQQITDTVRKVALALQEAHDKGVIHRDLKPANIMIDRRGEPIVTDFGLSRRDHATEVPISQSDQVLGTAAYMSPEQARGDGKSVGPQSALRSRDRGERVRSL